MFSNANQNKKQHSNQYIQQNSKCNINSDKKYIENMQHSNKQQFSTLIDSQEISYQDNLKAALEIEKKLIHYIPSLIHDLRNPLQQIYACVEFYGTQLNQIQNPIYEILQKGVNHMSELITKALTTFQSIIERKDESKINQLNYENVDINSFLEEFWTNNLAIAEQKQNVDYQIFVQSSLPQYVKIPQFEVTQIIQNLFSNATKFTDKGSIKLIVSFVELSEEDNSLIDTKENDILYFDKQQYIQSNKQFQSQETSTSIQLIKNNLVKQRGSEINDQKYQNQQYIKQSSQLNQIAEDSDQAKINTEQEYLDDIEESLSSQNFNKQKREKLEQIQRTPITLNQMPNLNEINNFNDNSKNLKQMNDSYLPKVRHFNKKETCSHRLKQKLQSITYQFNKLKYSQQQDNDYLTNTEEDFNEDYLYSELNQECYPFCMSNSVQIDDNQKCCKSQNILQNQNTERMINSSYGLIKKNLPYSNLSSSQLNQNYQVSKQPKNLLMKNTSSDSNSSEQNYQNNYKNILSNNYIENCDFSCQNLTPSTFQINTITDISNLKNINLQSLNKIQSLSSAKLTIGDNNTPIHDQSTQYHTPLTTQNNILQIGQNQFSQMIQYSTPQINSASGSQVLRYPGLNSGDKHYNQNQRNDQLKSDAVNLYYQNSTNQQQGNKETNKNILADFTSPDTESIHSPNITEVFQGRKEMNQISSDLFGNIKSLGNNKDSNIKRLSTLTPKIQRNYNSQLKIQKNKPASAEFEGSTKSHALSNLVKQQQDNKQNQNMIQSNISNFNQNLQLQQSQSIRETQDIKNNQQINLSRGQKTNSTSEKQFKSDSNEQKNSTQTCLSLYKENSLSYLNVSSQLSKTDLPNINEYCMIFSKRKSQIHPSIRDLVFSRNNIRNYQVRKVSKIKGYLKFEILDTGKGMDKNEQVRIFDLYKQANSKIKEQYGGSGIGLYSAKNIANYLNGDVYCHSQKGVGSAFIFYMPCEANFKTEYNQDEQKSNQQQLEKQYSDDINYLDRKQNIHNNSQIKKESNLNQQLNNQVMSQNSQNQIEKDNFNHKTKKQLQQNINTNNQNYSQPKFSQQNQQQLQIMQIKQDLKSADTITTKVQLQNRNVFIRQQSSNINSFPSQKYEDELNQLLLLLEQKKKRINMIYIDDNEFLLQTMEIQLGQIKHVDLTIENSALNGLQIIKKNPNKFDIALIDHEMPELNGKEVAKEIRQINPNIILICHSGFSSSSEFKQQCIKSGFQYFLDKPCQFQDIILLFSSIYKINNNDHNQNLLSFSKQIK